jgi:carbon-monoxide dehydrogenase medium subunit
LFEYARPTNLATVLQLMTDVPEARLLSGGTDLLVAVRKGQARPRLVIDLKRVAELAPRIEQRGQALRISASTVLTEIIGDKRVQAHFPALVEASLVVGSIQIRNRATLAGNLCNASPAADTATPLLVHDAVVEVAGLSGRRLVALDDFFVGPGRTMLGPAELVSAVELPIPGSPLGSAFARMTRRRGVDLATVNLCCSVSTGGVTTFAYGAVGPRPFRVADSTGVLADATSGPAEQDEVLGRMTSVAAPISNVRASREYREAMLVVLSRRALDRARARLAEARHGS